MTDLYPNGQCDACGFGLSADSVCTNLECSRLAAPECHPDCGPITQRHEHWHKHANEDGSCWHANLDAPEGIGDDPYTTTPEVS